jgi:hypothetical protein
MQLKRGHLGDRNETLDPINLQIGLGVAEHLDELKQVRGAPCMAWRWKNCSPAKPFGALMMEQGRPLMCSISQGPTSSK